MVLCIEDGMPNSSNSSNSIKSFHNIQWNRGGNGRAIIVTTKSISIHLIVYRYPMRRNNRNTCSDSLSGYSLVQYFNFSPQNNSFV